MLDLKNTDRALIFEQADYRPSRAAIINRLALSETAATPVAAHRNGARVGCKRDTVVRIMAMPVAAHRDDPHPLAPEQATKRGGAARGRQCHACDAGWQAAEAVKRGPLLTPPPPQRTSTKAHIH